MNELLQFAASPPVMISLAAAFSVFVGVYAVSTAAATKRERMGRVRTAAARSGRNVGPRRGASAQGSGEAMQLINRVVQRVNVMRDRTGAALSEKLARAGWRSKDAVTLYLFGKLALPFVGLAGAAGYIFLVNDHGLSMLMKVGAVVAGALVGSYIPETVVRNQTSKRAKAMTAGLPDALDLMVICAEAGLSLDASFKRVARELKTACPELADEFNLTLLELRFMPERRRALENLTKRVDLRAMTALVNTLFQTEKFGTPLAQALRVLAAELREERMLRAEEKAARLPAIMTVPLIIFIMPALFIVLIGPAILDIGDVFKQVNG